MNRNETPWALFLAALVFLAYLLPFSFLRNVTAWYGSFLFWVLYALAVIGVLARMTRSWQD